MPSSGTYTFTVSANDIVNAALRTLQVIDQTSVASSTDLTNCIQALNLLLKGLATQGMPIWTAQWVQIPMVTNQTSYTIGPSGNLNLQYRPTRLISAFLRTNTTSNDVTLQIISRQEYEMLGIKSSTSIPNQIYYDNQLTLPVIYFYNTPVDTSTTAWLSVQRPIQDVGSSTNTFDVPIEWASYLKWNLAEELLLEYSVAPSIIPLVIEKAKRTREAAMNMSQEEASVYFSVDPQTYFQNRGV